MSRASNGHRSTESTWSIAAAANQGIRVHHTTPSSSNGDMGDRPQTTHVNRRSGGVFAFESDGADHRATWSGNEHGDRHAWKQGYTFVGSAVANQAANGGADSRANGSMRENGGSRRPSANGPAMQSVTNGTRGPADASLADDTRRPSPSSTARHSLSTKPLALPLGHGIVFTIEGFVDDDPEPHPNGTHASSASSPIQPLTPGRSAYQLPALGTFGGVESFHNELFSIPDAESINRSLAGEVGRLAPAAKRDVAQAVVNANAHTRDMLAASHEILSLLALLRKDPTAPRFVPTADHAPLAPATRPSSIRSFVSAGAGLSRSSSIRTIRSMIQCRHATMLSTSTTASSDDDTETEPAENVSRDRWSEERALGSFLQFIERRGITEPEVEALRRHMPANGGRQPRRFPHRAHTKSRRTKKKKRSRKDKGAGAETGDGAEGEASGPAASGSESDRLGWDSVWEDVGKVEDRGQYLAEIRDVEQWYNLRDVWGGRRAPWRDGVGGWGRQGDHAR